MVAYSFKACFEAPIKAGLKTQTIRGFRPRHAFAGEMLQLFVGMRTRHCRRILPDQVCIDVMLIEIGFDEADRQICDIRAGGVPVRDLDAFARRDGFADLADMSAFWRASHKISGTFHGVLIEWRDPGYVRRSAA